MMMAFSFIKKFAVHVFKKSIHRNKCSGSQNFISMIQKRREEAERSVLVQVHSVQSVIEVEEIFNKVGDIKNVFTYLIQDYQLYVLVEFKQINYLTNMKETTLYGKTEDRPAIFVPSPFLMLKTTGRKKKKIQINKNVINLNSRPKQDDAEVFDWLSNAESISHQLEIYHNLRKLNELESRLRFLTARQIEKSICGLFPLASVALFGSSVNNFGQTGCDLDLVLTLSSHNQSKEESKLIYQSKDCRHDRSRCQRDLNIIADIIQDYLPGCVNVRRILRARVPIIKFNNTYTGVECDLSMHNDSARMAELLHRFTTIDDRVTPLVFTVKQWAKTVGLTKDNPGEWLTNFSLTLLVIFFLQQSVDNKHTILPPLKSLGSNFQTTNINNDTLETLIFEFFHFYATFDFKSKAISIISGKVIPKSDYSPMYIINPLDRQLNICKNVSLKEAQKFKNKAADALYKLNLSKPRKIGSNWGIISLLIK